MKRLLGIVALCVVGCHDQFSNEDLQFRYDGVPPQIEIVIPTENGPTGVGQPGGPPPPGTAQFYGDARRIADTVNQQIFSVLTWINVIAALPPTIRMENQRVWGPLPGDDGVEYTLFTDRVDTSTVFRATATSTPTFTETAFDFALIGRSAAAFDGRIVLSGRQVTESAGAQGVLVLNFDAAREVNPNDTQQGTALLGYDTRHDQTTIELLLSAPALGPAADAAWRHSQKSDGGGDFLFFKRENVDPTTSALEQMIIAARWRADGQGRADVWVINGDLVVPLFASECWDAAFNPTYLLSNIPDPAYFPRGALTDCAPDLRVPQFPP
ncbi:MAG: hypothetical protein AAFV29_18805 [Myxococcota bacterium]